MAKTGSTLLFELIKSMNRNEKRHFKLSMTHGSTESENKTTLLFDRINAMEKYSEAELLKSEPSLKPEQLPNMKAYLFEKIMQSLRLYHADKFPEIKIREQIDFARLLIERRMYRPAKNCLIKAKKMARQYSRPESLPEIIQLEKDLLMQHEGGNTEEVDKIIKEVIAVNSGIANIHIFSNLSAKLNAYYTRIGYMRDEQDYNRVRDFFISSIPEYEENELSFTEKLHLYRLFVGYYFFVQDFENGHLYSLKMLALFEENPGAKKLNPEAYITALNNVLTSRYKLKRFDEFEESYLELKAASRLAEGENNQNLRIRLLKYSFAHEINRCFLNGEFDEGVRNFEERQKEIDKLNDVLDRRSNMILQYKIACLYFGAGNFDRAIKWLNKIINTPADDIREDLHCFSRILILVCHFELGNFDVIKFYILSTYRFLLKKDDLRMFQQYILSFLKNLSWPLPETDLIERFQALKLKLLPLVDSTFEKRAFIYFDIVSWLESKIENRPVKEVMHEKFIRSRVPGHVR